MTVRAGLIFARPFRLNDRSTPLVLDSGALVPLTFVTNVDANVRIDVDVPDGLFE